MKKNITKFKIFSAILGFLFLFLPFFHTEAGGLLGAFGKGSNLEKMATSSGYNASEGNNDSLELKISLIIQAALGLLGVLFIVLTIYAGITWMTAAGNEESIKKAATTLKHNVVGLIIVLLAYVISIFIIRIFTN
jgi:cytochrome bd-type quinol oxidase subunit 2